MCRNCKHLFIDSDVGYAECTKMDEFTKEQIEEYEVNCDLSNCPFYEEEGFDLLELLKK